MRKNVELCPFRNYSEHEKDVLNSRVLQILFAISIKKETSHILFNGALFVSREKEMLLVSYECQLSAQLVDLFGSWT